MDFTRADFDTIRVMTIPDGFEGQIENFLPNARSIVVAGECYACTTADCSVGAMPLGSIAPYTRANFYRVLRDKLRRLATTIDGRCKLSVNGRLPERALALAAGLGQRGHNGLLLTPQFGSLVVLGILVTTAQLPPSPPALIPPLRCDDCRACLRACPTAALTTTGLDRTRCIQALCTEDTLLAEDIMQAWGLRLYGCSVCQDVCPYNADIEWTRTLPTRGRVGPAISVLPLLSMSEDEYRASVAGNQLAARWVPFRAIRRNALITLAHSRSTAVQNVVASACTAADDLIAATARWVRGQINSPLPM